MSTNQTATSELFELLKARDLDPIPLDTKNKRVQPYSMADILQFTFKQSGKAYNKAWITLSDDNTLAMYYSDKDKEATSSRSPNSDYDDSWVGFLKTLKRWAMRHQMAFELKDSDRLQDDINQREHLKMNKNLNETYRPAGRTKSYNEDSVPSVKIILQHSRQLEETDQRFRHIDRIFLETSDGERFRAPTNKPGVAKLFARHLAEGGTHADERWNHIQDLHEEYSNLGKFVRATREKRDLNESATAIVNEVSERYHNLRTTMKSMIGPRGYNSYFESWTGGRKSNKKPGITMEELVEMFGGEDNPNITEAAPYIGRFASPRGKSPVQDLEEWADSVIDETIGSSSDDLEYGDDEDDRYENFDDTKDEIREDFGDLKIYKNITLPQLRRLTENEAEHHMMRGYCQDKYAYWWDGFDGTHDDFCRDNSFEYNEDYFMIAEWDPFDGFMVGAASGVPEWARKRYNAVSDLGDLHMKESISANQKRVGQLGPTEKVKKNSGAKGKLVGVSETMNRTAKNQAESRSRKKLHDAVDDEIEALKKLSDSSQ